MVIKILAYTKYNIHNTLECFMQQITRSKDKSLLHRK